MTKMEKNNGPTLKVGPKSAKTNDKGKNKRKYFTTKKNASEAENINAAHAEQQTRYSSNWETFLKEAKERPKAAVKPRHLADGQTETKAEVSKRLKNRLNKKRKLLEREKVTAQENANMIDQKDIWFDDVDMEEIENATGKKMKLPGCAGVPSTKETTSTSSQNQLAPRETRHVAVDCEMVGVGIDGKDHMLARVSLVNSFGETIYDKFVAPMQKVIDYRTEVSGVRPEDLKGAPNFKQVQEEVAALTKDKTLVGHSLNNDLKVLLLSHPRKNIRDTANYKPFKKLLKTRFPSLKKLAKEVLQVDIQSGEHSSVEDARHTMKIFQLHKKQWEKSLKEKGHKLTVDSTPKIFMGKQSDSFDRHRKRRSMERKKKKKSF